MSAAVAERAFENLARHNVFDVRITGELRYQFSPGTPDMEKAAVSLADAYQQNPLGVTQFVTGVAQRNIRDFADAFRIRHDDDS